MRRSLVDRGAVQLSALALVGAVAVGAGTAGVVTQRALSDGSDGPETAVEAAAEGRGTVAAYDCEGTTVVGRVSGGDRIYVTAVSADDDAWLRIRNPLDPTGSWWIDAGRVDVDTDLDGLPAVGCDDGDDGPGGTELAAGAPTTTVATLPTDPTAETTVPGEEPFEPPEVPGLPPATQPPPTPGGPVTTLGPSGPVTTSGPSPTTTAAPGTTTTPPPVDTSGPSLSVSVSTADIWEEFPASCADKPKTSVITAAVSDPSGVTDVRARWSRPGTGGQLKDTEVLVGGSTRTGTIGPYTYPTVPSNAPEQMSITVTATDGLGNKTSKKVDVTLHSVDECFG